MTTTAPLTLRPAHASDAGALARLAALDSQTVGAGPYLVAESSGGLVAAVSERTGRAIADPFQRSGQAVDLLDRWREQRTAERVAARPRTRRSFRLVAARAL
jgi:hypothetical protein